MDNVHTLLESLFSGDHWDLYVYTIGRLRGI